MKQTLYILFLGLLSTSCSSTYFFSTLSSTNAEVTQVENGDFLTENEDLWIAYSFKGENAPMRITVFNKSTEPLYINWKQSELAFADQTYADSRNAIAVDAFNLEENEVFDREGKPVKNVRRDKDLPEHISFIPPNTMISHVPVRFNAITSFGNFRKGTYAEATVADKNNKEKKVDEIKFSKENSPLKFRSSLTVYTKSGKATKFRNEFYLSNLIKTNKINPQSMSTTMSTRGDMFYMEKQNDNKTLHVGTSTAVIAGTSDVEVIVHQ